MAVTDPTTCEECGGDGVVEDELCTTCFGQGSLPITGIYSRLTKKVLALEDKLDDIMDKCNDIFERVSE